jgi:FixJ family two-component response regulator
MESRPFVCVVDDDESVRESLPDLLGTFGFTAEAFASAREFLAAKSGAAADCLILDIAMPEMSGPELQAELLRQGRRTPVIFITSHSVDEVGPRVIAKGAVACLVKPFTPAVLQEALNVAIDRGGVW